MVEVIIGSRYFKTQKAAKDYMRELLKTIGVCGSVRSRSDESYDFLLHLAQRHPNAKSKLKDIADFAIVNNVMNVNAFELHCVSSSGNHTDISWISCVSGKPNSQISQLNAAFRVAIDDQIKESIDN